MPKSEYPKGVLTKKFVPQYEPIVRRFADVLTVDGDPRNCLSRLYSPKRWTSASKAEWNAILPALAAHYSLKETVGSPTFYTELCIAFMYAHVPALKVTRTRGPKLKAELHFNVIKAELEAARELQANGKWVQGYKRRLSLRVAQKLGIKGSEQHRYTRAKEKQRRAHAWAERDGFKLLRERS